MMSSLRLDREELTDVRVFSGIFFPLLTGIALFGWRAAILIALVILGAQIARWILSRLLSWPAKLSCLSISVNAGLVAMFLPAQLVDIDINLNGKHALWPIPIAIGMSLTILTWLIARMNTSRISAVVLASMISILMSGQYVHTDRVLQRDHVFRGNLLDERIASRLTSSTDPWLAAPVIKQAAVLHMDASSSQINEYLNLRTDGTPRTMTISRLISEYLPPMEDLVIGGQPALLGMGSILTITIGGLLLVYRGMVAFRVPVLMIFVVYLTLLICPVPVIVSPEENIRRWLAGSDPRVGWSTGITFNNYVLFSSSALAVTFYLACRPGIRPYRGTAAIVFAILFGILCGLSILYISVDYGPLLALLVAQLIAPTFDRRFRSSVVAGYESTSIVESKS